MSLFKERCLLFSILFSSIAYGCCLRSSELNYSKNNIADSSENHFFDTLDEKAINSEVLKWMCPYKYSFNDFNESDIWYNFLNNLYCKFSEYKIQVQRRNYTVYDVEHLGNQVVTFKEKSKEECDIQEYIDIKTKGIDLNEVNVEDFLNKTVECNITNHDNIKNIIFTRVRLEELNNVLNLTLNDAIYVNCDQQNIFFKGNFITTGDIVLNFLSLERNIKNLKCKEILLNESPKVLNIFSLNTLFIDVDITSSLTQKYKIEKINIIAPTWIITGSQKIELTGKDGILTKISNTNDGEPGKPGEPGGNFFGIGNEFFNGENLKISVNGGDATAGQDGKNGTKGVDRFAPSTPSDFSCSENLCDGQNTINSYTCQKLDCFYIYYTIGASKIPYLDYCKYKMFGKPGTKGSDGGDGGTGGKGGYPGIIKIFELNSPSQIIRLNSTGQDGEHGKGGIGGIGGKRGNDIIVKCRSSYFRNYWFLLDNLKVYERADSGRNGTDGANSKHMKMPETASQMSDLDLTKIINNYKYYLRQNLDNRFTNYSLNVFLKKLENNNDIKSLYNTLGFIDELKCLEEQFHLLNNINFLSFYESLLHRISEYAKNLKEEYSTQHKKVLAYLYTVILGRIQNIKDNFESSLIVDIESYLKFVKEDIKQLKDVKNVMYKEEIINKYKEEYKKEIDVKIKEANDFIFNDIIPEIDNIGSDIDTEIELLVKEIIYLQDQTIIEHEKLNQKLEKLQNSLITTGFFSIIKIVSQTLTFLGPSGKVAGTVIGTGSTIAESFVSGNDDGHFSVFELPQGVSELETINSQIKHICEHRLICLKNTLKSISQEIIKNPEILSNISTKINSIKEKLDKIEVIGCDNLGITALEKEIETTLKFQETGTKGSKMKILIKEKNDQKAYKGNYRNSINLIEPVPKISRTEVRNTSKDVIDNLKQIVQMGTLLSDIYNEYKNNQAKLDIINEAIKQNEENLRKLKRYEQEIYSTIIPMLQGIQEDLGEVISKLHTKSKVALDVTKWHVKSSLRDILLLLKDITNGLLPQDNLARCIEKLIDAVDITVDVYKHITDYQEDQNYVSFIAKISSISDSDISIAQDLKLEEALRNATLELEVTVRSSIVVQRHKVAINALKQIVFPFAHTYFGDLILPSHLELTDSESSTAFENLVSRAVNEIEKINSKLEEYKTAVRREDGCNGKGFFVSGRISSKPFFVWKNEQHKNLISSLLSGGPVIIKSDIRSSASYKDAIKFNVAEFHFKSKNETLQSEIDTKLKGYQLFMTHLGNSYYRYENKFYKIMTASQEIWYSFDRKRNGEPFQYSDSYEKFKLGNSSLSPYASWKIKLDTTDDDNSSFSDLEMYKDVVDILLEGRGHYINKRSTSCENVMADKYYEAIDVMTESEFNVQSGSLENVFMMQENEVFNAK